MNTVTVKCVVCHHQETIALTLEEPFCSKCFGPMTVVQIDIDEAMQKPRQAAFTPPSITEDKG